MKTLFLLIGIYLACLAVKWFILRKRFRAARAACRARQAPDGALDAGASPPYR